MWKPELVSLRKSRASDNVKGKKRSKEGKSGRIEKNFSSKSSYALSLAGRGLARRKKGKKNSKKKSVRSYLALDGPHAEFEQLQKSPRAKSLTLPPSPSPLFDNGPPRNSRGFPPLYSHRCGGGGAKFLSLPRLIRPPPPPLLRLLGPVEAKHFFCRRREASSSSKKSRMSF